MPNLFAGTGSIHVAFAHLADRPTGPDLAKDPYTDMVVASTARSEVAVFFGQPNWNLASGKSCPSASHRRRFRSTT